MSEFNLSSTESQIKSHLEKLYIIVNKYKWIIDIYVSDFFTKKLGDKVDKNWWNLLVALKPNELVSLLTENYWKTSKVWPLSLLAFRKAIHSLSLKRFIPESAQFKDGQYLNLDQIFRRHVKPKKQHEIFSAAKIINIVSQRVGTNSLIDFGGGHGHLSRLLSYQYGLNAITIDACSDHKVKCKIFDRQVEKLLGNEGNIQRCHMTETIKTDISPDKFLDKLQKNTALQNTDSKIVKTNSRDENIHENDGIDNKYTFITLHGCGNLIPAILRLYSNCKRAVGLVNISCCYMKMDESESFPLSNFLQSKPDSSLSWEAKELACHFIDSYIKKLKENHPNLISHCYRAAVQEILLEKDKKFSNTTIKLKIKNVSDMEFTKYALKVFEKLKFPPGLTNYQNERSKRRLSNWFEVVALYVLRLALAPALETIILLDRLLYLREKGLKSYLQPIFDPTVSPRNFALISEKSTKSNLSKSNGV